METSKRIGKSPWIAIAAMLLVLASSTQAASTLTVTAMSPVPGSTVASIPASIILTLSGAIDPASVNSLTIQMVRAGPDGIFGTPDDVMVTPTSISVVNSNQIRIGLNSSLPLDKYKVTLVSAPNVPSTGLVGYWPFNESNGTIVADASGNGNAGTLSGGTSRVPGLAGNGVQFDAATFGQMKVARSGSLEPANAITVSTWAKITGVTSGFVDLMRKESPFNAGYLLRWNNFSNGIEWDIVFANGSPIITVKNPLSNTAYLNAWHNFTGTYDGSTGLSCLYVDGLLTASQPGSPKALLHTDDLYFMYANYSQQAAAPGILEDSRIYNRALSASEIALLAKRGIDDANYIALDGEFSGTFPSGDGTPGGDFSAQFQVAAPSAQGLVAWYKLDEASGIVAIDSAGSNNGTLTGGVSRVGGVLSGALGFDGTTGYVNTSNSPDLGGGSMTASAWIYRQSGVEKKFISKWGSTTAQLQFDFQVYQDSKLWFQVMQTSGVSVIARGNTALDLNKWYHVAAVADAGNQQIRIYINGVLETLQQQVVWDGTIQSVNMAMNIGRKAAGVDYWSGKIDEVRVYNRALSAAEILALTVAPPAAGADTFGAAANQILSVSAPGVLSNDSDLSGATITAALDSNVSHGALILNANGSFVYTPANGFMGADSFSYHAVGNGGVSPVTSVALNVVGIAITSVSPSNAEIGQLVSNISVNGGGFQPSAVTIPNGAVLYNGHNYLYVATTMTWPDARTYCQTLGGHLATIGSLQENAFVHSLAPGEKWIGLTDEITEGSFVWVTNEPLTFTNWQAGQPDNNGNEDYVHFFADGTWNDAFGTLLKPFVCEFDTASTIIKLKKGSVEIPAAKVRVISASLLQFDIDLTMASAGVWDVVATDPNTGAPAALIGGFTITSSPTTLVAAIPLSISYNSLAQGVSLSASVSPQFGIVNEGNVTFQLLNANVNVGAAVTSGTVTNGLTGSVIYNLPAGTPPGNYTISATYNGTSNYTSSLDTSQQFSINPAALVVTSANTSRAYGADNPALNGTLTGVQPGDGITATYATTALPSSAVNTYPIIPTLVDPNNKLGNYAVTLANGTLTVTKATLAAAAANAARTYGTANPIFSGVLSGVLNGDNILALYSTAATSATAAGNYAIVPSLFDPDGKVSNYTLNLSNGTLTINKATLSVQADSFARTYGASNPDLTGTITGIQNSDNITATYSTTATSASAIGNYAIVPTLVDPNSLLSNYTLTSINGTLTISQAPLTVSAADATRVYHDLNPDLTGTISGLQNGDIISATYATTATCDSFAGTYPIVPTLLDPNQQLGNYSVASINGTLTIAQATPAITWATPAAIIAVVPLSDAQLNASASDAITRDPLTGAFAYSPDFGTILALGLAQTLTVVFTPDDSANYATASATTTIDVTAATPVSITSILTDTAQKGVAYTYTITADGSNPITLNATGLPAGLTRTGSIISGTPTVTGVFIVTLTAANYANTDTQSLKLTITQSGTNHAPVITSPPTVSANPALTNSPITTSASATDADNDNLDYEWDFGDGTSGHGASVTKSYAADGVYIVKLTVSDGQATDTQSVNIVVDDQFPTGVFTVKKVALALNFIKPASDSLSFSGQIPVPAGFIAAGKTVRILIGGIDKTYSLTSKSASPDKAFALAGKPKNGVINYSFALKKQNLFTLLEDLGISKTKSTPALPFPIVIVLDGKSYFAQPAINYSAKSNKKGPLSGKGRS